MALPPRKMHKGKKIAGWLFADAAERVTGDGLPGEFLQEGV